MQNPFIFFIGHPLRIAAIALALFAIAWALTYFRDSGSRTWPVLVPGGLWAAYAVWEYAVSTFSPEANIRVDLLLIYPVLFASTLAAVGLQRWWYWKEG